MSRETALVLSGGGAKGMYHIGAWQALREMDISFDAVIGNSAGALVAGFMAQGDFETAQEVIQNLDISKVVNIPPEFLDKGQFTINENNLMKLSKIQKSFVKEKGLDTAPLRELLYQHLNEDKIRNSSMDLGIATFQLNKLKAREIFVEEMEQGEIINYLLASATVPGFKLTHIGENSFIDGGVYNNIPVDMARARGYRNIIVIDIAGLGVTKKIEMDDCTITYIKNKSDLGGLLDFNKDVMQKLRDLGYRDTMRVFGKLEGLDFYLEKDDQILASLESLWKKNPAEKIPEDLWKESDGEDSSRLLRRLCTNLPQDRQYFRNKILLMAECAALTLNLDKNKIYTWKTFLKLLSTKHQETLSEVWTIMETLSEGPAAQRVKKALELTVDFQKYQKEEKYKYFLLSMDLRETFPHLPIPQIENNYGELNPARIFLNLLEEWERPPEE